KPILIAGLFTLTTALATSTLAATEAPGKHHQRHMERMASELQLTEQQQEQLRDIHQQQREQMRTLREQRQEQVNAVLTEEQRNTPQQLREQRPDELRRHMQQRRQGRAAERDADTTWLRE